MSFEYLQGLRLHNFSGKPVPVLSYPYSEKVVPDDQTDPPMLQFVPIASGPVTGHHRKEPCSLFLTPALQIFIYIGKFPQ